MKNWKISGLIATIIIVLSIPFYLINFYLINEVDPNALQNEARFVGRENCIDCHKKEYDLWKGSHHDDAMDVATNETVLGDFNNSEFVWNGDTSRFYKKGERFFVYTAGPGGIMAEFEITYTFGVTPLQQYLIPFDGGRLQCLPITWDSEKNKWFHMVSSVYPGQDIDPSDWLYWTNAGQNWNGMCAECHSTNLKKNYNLETKSYNTTWSEIDVSCEACHGPGSLHVDWAQIPEMARPSGTNYGLVVRTSGLEAAELVDLCAPCHSRRTSLGDNTHDHDNLYDKFIPQLISEPLYFADGQILEEDYVYGSFVQSKMFEKEVRCSDCHDSHSGQLIEDGNKLCAQCHRTDIYDSFNHHFHKYEGEDAKPLVLENGEKVIKVGEGALCVNCHMPGRYYMGNDFRNDHSMRVPRPDISIEIGTPNACNQCHTDKSNQWSVEHIEKWYGVSRPIHFGVACSKAGDGDVSVIDDLIDVTEEELYTPIVRATALTLLGNFEGDTVDKMIDDALYEQSPMIRSTAVQLLRPSSAETLVKQVGPLLNDPVKAVRIRAASQLSVLNDHQLLQKIKPDYRLALEEYIEAMEYTGDFASGRHNLANLYSNLGDLSEAEKHYKVALEIDNLFMPAKVNLAMIYNRQGKNEQAEVKFRKIIEEHPEFEEAYYSLGLLLAEKQEFEEAAVYLEKAAELMPERTRINYNLGLIYQYLNYEEKAEKNFLAALKKEPQNFDYHYALADFYIKTEQWAKAKKAALNLRELDPDNQVSQNILDHIEQQKVK